MNTPKALAERFPYMFAGPHIGIGIARGWFDVFVQLCVDIDQTLGDDKQGFRWGQVKEKFGTGRFYADWGRSKPSLRVDLMTSRGVIGHASVPADSTKRRVTELIRTAESSTMTRCMICGSSGSIDSTGGYLMTLCAVHADMRRRDVEMPSAWFTSEEDIPQ